ncbi:tail completion or Neck1 protein [Desulfofustis phage LS06-2018-MD02]|jgi:HK97 gp10 family phage protein|nr:tail completion or Neck1 protein [Desulfofustis phage LS06-2018-MD02]
MPRLTVRVRNLSSLQAKVKRLNWSVQGAVFRALRGLANPIEQDIKQELRKTKSGPVVTRYNPKRRVKVSLPYEEPATDLGMLVNSIEVDVDPLQFNMVIAALAPYARELEYGTRYMLPRPFLRPALTRWRRRIIDSIHKAIKEAL